MMDRALTFALSVSVLGVYLSSTPPHLISDLSGGLLAVLIPFYVFPEIPTRPVPGARGNRNRALFYFVPSLLCFLLSVALWPWGSVLLWPAICYLIVSWAYAAGKPGVFRKARGRLDWAASILLAPHLWMSKSSLSYLRRRVPPWAMAAPQVFFGRLLDEWEPLPPDIVAVLDLTAEHRETPRLREFEYLNIPVLDQTLLTRAQLEQALSFIEQHLERGSVYIHCTFGYSRSAGVAAAYLLKARRAPSAVRAALDLEVRRPQISLSRDWMALLEELEAALPPAPADSINPEAQESSSRH